MYIQYWIPVQMKHKNGLQGLIRTELCVISIYIQQCQLAMGQIVGYALSIPHIAKRTWIIHSSIKERAGDRRKISDLRQVLSGWLPCQLKHQYSHQEETHRKCMTGSIKEWCHRRCCPRLTCWEPEGHCLAGQRGLHFSFVFLYWF